MGPRTHLDDTEGRKILPLLGLKCWLLSHPAHSQFLQVHRLGYASYCVYHYSTVKTPIDSLFSVLVFMVSIGSAP
jgi:hypothetical protein